MHLKRQKIPKTWPLERKSTTYVVKPSHSLNKGIPILVLLRDILEIAKDRREVKKAIFRKQVFLNGKNARDEKNNALLFDTLTLKSIDGKTIIHYRVELGDNKKFCLTEINEKEANKKVSKVINKKLLKGRKIQINLIDGRNFLSNLKCKVNDSVLIDFEKNELSKHLPLSEKSNAVVFAGKHSGQKGIIKEIDEKNKVVKISTKNGEINVLVKQIIVVE